MIQQATQLFAEAEFDVAMAEALPLPDAPLTLPLAPFHFIIGQINLKASAKSLGFATARKLFAGPTS